MTFSRPLIASLAAAAALTLTLAGCTGSDDATPSGSASPSASASASAGDPGITDVTDTPGAGTDGDGGGFTGALADAEVSDCAAADGAWQVSGTVTNPTDADADYRIYVSLLNGGGETRALTQVDVDGVEAGESSEWDTTVDLGEDGLNCVLRVERYAA